jgi:hypothetical protein
VKERKKEKNKGDEEKRRIEGRGKQETNGRKKVRKKKRPKK